MVTFCCPLVNEMLKFALTNWSRGMHHDRIKLLRSCICVTGERFVSYYRLKSHALYLWAMKEKEMQRFCVKLNLVRQRWSVYVMQSLYHTGTGAEEGQKYRLNNKATKCPLLSSHLYVSWTPFEVKRSRACATRCHCRGEYPRISMLHSHFAFTEILIWRSAKVYCTFDKIIPSERPPTQSCRKPWLFYEVVAFSLLKYKVN